MDDVRVVDPLLTQHATLADWKIASPATKLRTVATWMKYARNHGIYFRDDGGRMADSIASIMDQDIDRAIDEHGHRYNIHEYGTYVVAQTGLAMQGGELRSGPVPERNIDRIGRRTCLAWLLVPGLLVTGLYRVPRAWSVHCSQQANRGFPAADGLLGRIIYSFCPQFNRR